ncbi:hypothetical protein FKW77_003517 [Venturia effusa]|uniref:AAA+ ATPase domain-containing protein n=1 Tax=Venturia effusa TaxID=50376 RepID=A0A517LGW1_9PEZI|nr:hypothetical protein FKW77_003517 [Venturia effusa]
MEQTANRNPDSASAQNAFYAALLRANRPDLVVQRFDTGQFASNAATEATYKKALEKVVQTDGQIGGLQNNTSLNSDQLGAVAQAIGARSRGGNSAFAKSGSGAKDAPLYVVVEESYGTTIFKWVKFFAWFAFAVWIFYVIISFLVEGAGLLKRVGGINVNEAKPELQKTKFSDVEGCDEAKEELQELVAFLKDPKQFSALGGKLPKGVLLVGPPGTGKTLLARAVAGEAGVPFFYASGSEFDEMYVGVGAKRVRELFTSARAKSPAIIFIDELDAIGGKRNPRDGAYAKQTLNQLLTELDGFDQGSGIIIIAATNFPESLDSALTRPGRFDRNVNVPLPDVRGRMAILKLKLKNMQLGTDVDLEIIARGTTGFSGADLENLANQAAVHASKRKATKIHMSDYEWAKDKILMGPERRSAVIQEKDKIMTAYHEGGHALVALLTPYATPLYKATIMPRGHALGITYQLAEMDKVSESKQELLAQIDVCMGGKCAEIIVYGEDAVTSGSSSDITAATRLALAMVKRFGMSDKLGNLDLERQELPTGMHELVWDEAKRIIDESKDRVLRLLRENRKSLDAISKGLIDYEILNKVEMENVIRGEKLPDRLKSTSGPVKAIEPKKLPILTPPQPPRGSTEPGLGTPPPVDSLKIESLDPDSYVVMMKEPQNLLENVVDTVVDEVVTSLKLKPKRRYKNGKTKGFSAVLSTSQLSSLKANPKVAYIEPDATLNIQGTITPLSKRGLTTQPSSPWNLARLSHRSKGSNTYVYDTTSGSGTCSYILDTGLYTQHNDFSPSRATLIKNFDTSDNSNDDLSGHGTHVAAILGGNRYGVAKQTKILGVKVCNKNGACNLSDVIAGIDLVVADSKARASTCPNGVTMTLSFGTEGAGSSRSIQEGIVAATQAGIFVVAAAGNDNVDVKGITPAGSPFVCSVGASDVDDRKAGFSNFGAGIGVFAPGVAVQSAWIGGVDASQYLSGTSMAAPHVAGLGAYIMGMKGKQNPIGLCTTIKNSANMNALSGLPGGTPNRLAYNGAA